jgi:YggT family protein
MDVILIPLLAVLSAAIGIYIWIVVASVIVSWLVNFQVINPTHKFVITLIEFLYQVTEPILNKIRRFLPIIGGFDFSPLVLILFLWFLEKVIGRLILKIVMVGGV